MCGKKKNGKDSERLMSGAIHRDDFVFERVDLSTIVHPNVPACPNCQAECTVALQVEDGSWQILCQKCQERWSTDWNPLVALKMCWCVRYRDGWCALSTLPTNKPRYRDKVKTLCKHYIIMNSGYEKREPTCPECIKRLEKERLRK